MTLVSPAALLTNLAENSAVAAFNIISIEHLEAFVSAAERSNRGLILQLSQNAVRYHGGLAPMGRAILERVHHSSAPMAVQLDHANDVGLIKEAAELGFTSIMFDGSTMSYGENVTATRELASDLHKSGIWVEAELGEVGGKDGVHSATARTDPGEARDFVAATNIDGLAVAVGSSHAMIDQTAELDLVLISDLHAALPLPLVLHGSSGVPEPMIMAACKAGISKVNFGTRFNKTFTASLRAQLVAEPTMVDPRVYLGNARNAVSAEAEDLLRTIF